jgi:hypothetical protein
MSNLEKTDNFISLSIMKYLQPPTKSDPLRSSKVER